MASNDPRIDDEAVVPDPTDVSPASARRPLSTHTELTNASHDIGTQTIDGHSDNENLSSTSDTAERGQIETVIDPTPGLELFHDNWANVCHAWVEEKDGEHYRHRVTGETTTSRPNSVGPTEQDVPEGWRVRFVPARLVNQPDIQIAEKWVYTHCITGIKFESPPASLPQVTIDSLARAASFGDLPGYCEAFIAKEGSVHYRSRGISRYELRRGRMSTLPDGWHTSKHPAVIESDFIDRLTTDVDARQEKTRATIFAPGGRRSEISLTTRIAENCAGVLLIENIDRAWMDYLRFTFPQSWAIVLVTHHLLLKKPPYEDKSIGGLEENWEMWREMTFGPEYHGVVCDVFYDDTRCTLQFWGSLHRYSTCPKSGNTIRMSMQPNISSKLSLALMTGSSRTVGDAEGADFTEPIPRDATCWAPTYRTLDYGIDLEPRDCLVKLLESATKYHIPSYSSFLGESIGRNFPGILALCRWREGFDILSRDLDGIWTQATVGPSTKDFKRLNSCRKRAEKFNRTLDLYGPHFATDVDEGLRLLEVELKDLRSQTVKLKEDIGDTFQLLIGAIAIKDSEIQMALARESKIQAKRSTALTALAAIYLPLSLTTGVFGMNISEINQGVPKYWAVLALGIGLLVVSVPFLLWVFLDKDEDDVTSKAPRSSAYIQSKREVDGSEDEHEEEREIPDKDTARRVMADSGGFSRRRRRQMLSQARSTGLHEPQHHSSNAAAEPEIMV